MWQYTYSKLKSMFMLIYYTSKCFVYIVYNPPKEYVSDYISGHG